MNSITINTLAMCILASIIAGCGKEADVSPPREAALQEQAAVAPADQTVSKDLNASGDELGVDLNLAALLGDRDIPYPVYPNGRHYRIGDENGLKIIAFETVDTFEQVDAFYQQKAGMPRLGAMEDYVRYSTSDDDLDPWETSKPGIVIHQFNSDAERQAAGASDGSLTNIIMSFR